MSFNQTFEAYQKPKNKNKQKKTLYQEIEQKLDLDMVEILKFSYQDCKTTMVNMLSALMGKVENIKKCIGNISTEIETLRKIQKLMLEIKNSAKEMKTVFVGFYSRLYMSDNRINVLQKMSVESSKREYKEIKEEKD